MTPEEKTKELYFKFLQIMYKEEGILVGTDVSISAKSCATICCDEIIDTYASSFNPERQFWQQVKQHIQLL